MANPKIMIEIEKANMKFWLSKAFKMYNDLAEHMAKINIRDSKIKKEWEKIDDAIDNIVDISNKKGYFK
jgi:hypothetical protein